MSLDKIINLLNKQKLVEGVIQSQNLPRHKLVETIVHRQHLAELQNLMSELPSGEIGQILETLPIEDATLLWKQMPEERENDILCEVSDDC